MPDMREANSVDERMDHVMSYNDAERQARKKAWLARDCSHEFPEDQRLAFCAGWEDARAYFVRLLAR
jgi:hypothetical protein